MPLGGFAPAGELRLTLPLVGLLQAVEQRRQLVQVVERVLLELGSFPAPTFDALFEGVKALPWADYLPADAAFPVKGYSLESALHSVPDCQKIIKKAVVESLKRRYRVGWFAETGALYQIQFSLVHDTATLYLDTTGTPPHKRGYRPAHVAAPLRETLAAALVDIAGYRGRGDFCDRR